MLGHVCSGDAYKNQPAGLILIHQFQRINRFELYRGGFSSQKWFFRSVCLSVGVSENMAEAVSASASACTALNWTKDSVELFL